MLAITLVTLSIFAAIKDLSAQVTFFSNVEDLPIMHGLEEIFEAGMVFDKPEGRIIEVIAIGAVSHEAILDFYGSTLPELGWRRIGLTDFTRSGEILSFRIDDSDGEATIRFIIAPN
tara:strand:+ start:1181 stop:1531 length:351 start_codon:yes stop_codon:yes gene_type:complete